MQSQSSLIQKNLRGFGCAISCLFIIVLKIKFQLSDGVFNDPFHHGEYFTALITLLDDQVEFHPITIHGAVDFIPGLIAINIFSENNYFFPTRLIYELLNFLSAIIFLAVVYGFIKDKPKSIVVLLSSALVSPYLVGYRDTALISSIYFYFLIQKNNHPITNMFLEICFGLTVAIGLFWSFDRGIAGIVSLGFACIIHAYNSRLYLKSIFTFFATIASLGYFPQFSLVNYWENIKVLIETSSQWSYGWKITPIILTNFLIFSNLLTIWLLLFSAKINLKTSRVYLYNSLFLIILSLLLLKIGINRADIEHILWGLWGPLFSGLYWYSKNQSAKPDLLLKIALSLFLFFLLALGYHYRVVAFIPIAVLVFLSITSIGYSGNRFSIINKLVTSILIIPLFAAIYSISNGINSGKYHWVKYLNFATI